MPSLTLTAGEIAAATGGRVVSGDASTPIGRITIDSREATHGDLFVALRGERFDGHAFVAAALAAGAMGAVVAERSQHAVDGALIVEVSDTTRALQDLAREVRRRSGATVVAITGSAGKTTTKEICAEFLSARYRVFRNKGNLNNHIGLPLSLLDLRSGPEVAVVELGMNHPGEIGTLVRIAEPEVRVWTNVGDAHMGFFASAEAIADAKAEILEHSRPDDVMVANADDPHVMARVTRFSGPVITFGVDRPADVRAFDVALDGIEGIRARVDTPAGAFRLQSSLLGLGNLLNVLAATAVATHLGVPVAALAERAATLRPAHHRGELFRLPGGVTILDDSYNSSPSALKRSLEVVRAAAGSARKVLVLGEMLELGGHAERLHQDCGRAAAVAGADLLIAVGGDPARALAGAAREGGMSDAAVIAVETRDAAIDVLLGRLRPGDLVLVKGSRGIGLDAVVERLKVEFA